ncbi:MULTISPECIES: hypothetical protein [Mangrovibacter]|uniref:Multiple antibiotic resistance protein MarB n=1 Tax=Mangrovibacter plantisponsor TaxID=451513 RepID=A0A317Q176_9ENTR|nr:MULTISPECIES: hypothetical protein [Mangrovibacter]KEA52056.1 hypothetical protein DT73_14205 [Mangrovibacter sp. MFB070]PWW08109.1 hypothetical protein DES37_107152 [Mangrovibacter plantisponsor]
MKKTNLVTALLLVATFSSGAMAAGNTFSRPEAGSNIDNTVHQNHIEASHAFDSENLTAGNML